MDNKKLYLLFEPPSEDSNNKVIPGEYLEEKTESVKDIKHQVEDGYEILIPLDLPDKPGETDMIYAVGTGLSEDSDEWSMAHYPAGKPNERVYSVKTGWSLGGIVKFARGEELSAKPELEEWCQEVVRELMKIENQFDAYLEVKSDA